MDESFVVLTKIADLDHLIDASMTAPVLLYKHSDACGVCWRTQQAFEKAAESHADDPVTFGFVEVRVSRPVSNEAAKRLDVPHRSPQAILIVGGKAVWDTSHYSITPEAIEEAIAQHAA